VGLVAIGRNEGERLRACLETVVNEVTHVVYVDSGSTDGSVAMANAMGVHVVELDMALPFTAARARNAGWRALLEQAPHAEYVQFVDGDCAIANGWLQVAEEFHSANPDYAVACGRRRERFPEKSIYNEMCDIEWDTPIGDSNSCGGDALVRVAALRQVNGYREDLIAGEEPEMCVRLRKAGWKIRRLDHEMTLHDASMSRFGQWWRRTVRGGHAYAEGAWLHGRAPEYHKVRQTLRALFWGGLFPAFVFATSILFSPYFSLLLLAYPIQWIRLSLSGFDTRHAGFLVFGKFAEVQGVVTFYASLVFKRRRTLIEYK